MQRHLLLCFVLVSIPLVFLQTVPTESSYILALSSTSTKYQDDVLFQFTGGSELYIQGFGFSAPDISKNDVKVGGKDCPIDSKTASRTKITCVVPEMDILDKKVAVKVTVNGVESQCFDDKSSCSIQYIKSPSYLDFVVPNSPGIEEDIRYFMTVEDQKAAGSNYFINIGNFHCDLTNSGNQEIKGAHGYIYKCKVPKIMSGLYNTSIQFNNLIGKFVNKQETNHLRINNKANFQKEVAYQLMVRPVVSGIDSNKGSPYGNHIKITGLGFSSEEPENTVYYGDVPCVVLYSSYEEIDCVLEMNPAKNPSRSFFSGNAGFEWVFFENYNNWDARQKKEPKFRTTSQVLSTPINQADNYVEMLFGYFRAPLGGKYRFFVAADDLASILFSKEKNNPNRDNMVEIAKVSSWTAYRDYFNKENQISQWLELEEGGYYLMEVRHQEGGGGDNLQVAVEIEYDKRTPLASYVIQSFNISSVFRGLVFQIVIKNFDPWTSSFSLKALDKQSAAISFKADKSEFINSIASFLNIDKAYVSVTLSFTNEKNEAVPNYWKGSNCQIDVTLLKPQAFHPSVPKIDENLLRKFDESSQMTLQLNIKQIQTDPLAGTYFFKLNGVNTAEIDIVSENENNITEKIQKCLGDKQVKVIPKGKDFNFSAYEIHFLGMVGERITFEIDTTKISGGTPEEKPIMKIQTIRENPNNIFIDPVDSDMLYTWHSTEQIRVSVKGIEATCPKFTCDYALIPEKEVPKVAVKSVSGAVIEAEITNISDQNIIDSALMQFYVGVNLCPVFNLLSNTIKCDYSSLKLSAGKHALKLFIKTYGYLGFADGVNNEITKEITISSFGPKSASSKGKVILKIEGSGFALPSNGLNLTFVKIGNNDCPIFEVTEEKVTCIIPPSQNPGSECEFAIPITLSVNGIEKIVTSDFEYINIADSQFIKDLSHDCINPQRNTEFSLQGNPDGMHSVKEVFFRTEIGDKLGCNDPANPINDINPTLSTYTCNVYQGRNQFLWKKDYLYLGIVSEKYGEFIFTEKKIFFGLRVLSVSSKEGLLTGGAKLTFTLKDLKGFDESEIAINFNNKSENVFLSCQVIYGSLTDTEVTCLTPVFNKEIDLSIEFTSKGLLAELCETCKTFSMKKTANTAIGSVDKNEFYPEDDLTISVSNFAGSGKVIFTNKRTEKTFESAFSLAAVDSSTKLTAKIPADIIHGKYTIAVVHDNLGQVAFNYGVSNEILISPSCTEFTPQESGSGGTVLHLKGKALSTQLVITISKDKTEYPCKAFIEQNSSYENLSCYLDLVKDEPKDSSEKEINFSDPDIPGKIYSCPTKNKFQIKKSLTLTINSIGDDLSRDKTLNSFEIKYSGEGVEHDKISLYLISASSVVKKTNVVSSFAKGTILISFSNDDLKAEEYSLRLYHEGNGFFSFENIDSQKTKISKSLSTATTLKASDASYAGGGYVEIIGSNLDSISKQQLTVCKLPLSFYGINATTNGAVFTLPEIRSDSVASKFPELFKEKPVYGTVFADDTSSSNISNVMDMIATTTYRSQNSKIDCFVGYDYGAGVQMVYKRISIMSDQKARMFSSFIDSFIEGSDDGSKYEVIEKISYFHMDWNHFSYKENKRGYRYIRYRGPPRGANSNNNGCKIAELVVSGYKIITSNEKVCPVLTSANIALGTVSYKEEATSEVNTIDPYFALINSPTYLTISGKNFGTDVKKVSVMLSGKECELTAVSDETLKCTARMSSSKDVKKNGEIIVRVGDSGYAIIKNNLRFYFVEDWESPSTWSNGMVPQKGDRVLVNKGIVIRKTIDFLLKEIRIDSGVLLIDPKAGNIVVNVDCIKILNKGNFIVGTESSPFSNFFTLNFAMFVDADPAKTYMKFHLMEGTIELFGQGRANPISYLAASVLSGAQEITLADDVDWKAGDTIIIGPTDFKYDEADKVKIKSVVNSKTFMLESPLLYSHFAGAINYDGVPFDNIRAEVANIEKNIKITCKDITLLRRYLGPTIVIDYPGTFRSTLFKFLNVQFSNLGQPFEANSAFVIKNGDDLSESFVRYCAFDTSFYGGIFVEGGAFLRIEYNVLYKIYSFGIALKRGDERYHTIDNNIIFVAKYSLYSNSYDEYFPSAFLLSSPSNYITNNIVSGAAEDGFLFSLDAYIYSISSYDSCPSHEKILLFSGNRGHSIYGNALKFDGYIVALQYPCTELNKTSNPSLNNDIFNCVFWKTTSDAIFSNRIGHFTFRNIYLLDNKESAIFLRQVNESPEQFVSLQNIYIAGLPPDNPAKYDIKKVRFGVNLPSTRGFKMSDSSFFYFENEAYAIRVCAECNSDLEPNQHSFEKIQFRTSATSRILFLKDKAKLERLIDNDGSLSGQLSGFIIPFYNSANSAPCKNIGGIKDGLYCSATVKDEITNTDYEFSPITLKFYGHSPNLEGKALNVVRLGKIYSENEKADLDKVPMQNMVPNNRGKGWSLIVLPGFVYQFYWEGGVDFKQITIETSGFQSFYKDILLKYKYFKEVGNFKIVWNTFDKNEKVIDTIQYRETPYLLNSENNNVDGMNFFHSPMHTLLYFILNGKKIGKLALTAQPCNPCETKRNTFFSLSSDPNTWDKKLIPAKGEDVIIPFEKRVILDTDLPQLGNLIIDGELIFDELRSLNTLSANNIWVRKGRLLVGLNNKPFANRVIINLVGSPSSPSLIDKNLDFGNMGLIVTGELFFSPLTPLNIKFKLEASLLPGSKTLWTDQGSDFRKGQKLVVSPSTMADGASKEEIFTVTSIGGKEIGIEPAAKYYHYGSATVNKFSEKGELDERAIVMGLDRNFEIRGVSSDDSVTIENSKWGCHVLVTTYTDADKTVYTGKSTLSDTIITNCGQQSNNQIKNPALRYYNIKKGQIKFVVINTSFGAGIELEGCDDSSLLDVYVFNSYQYGIIVTSSISTAISNSYVLKVINLVDNSKNLKELSAGYAFFPLNYKDSTALSIKTSVATSCEYGFIIPAQICDDNSIKHTENQASSCVYGFLIYSSLQSATCIEISQLTAFKNYYGIVSYPRVTKLIANGLILADNINSLSINKAGDFLNSITEIKGSVIAGFSKFACDECLKNEGTKECSKLTGIILGTTTIIEKTFPPEKNMQLPWNSIQSDSTFFDSVTLSNNLFAYFDISSKAPGCVNNYIFSSNPQASDSTSVHILKQNKLDRTTAKSLVSYLSPPEEWKSAKYCGTTQCTGLSNILVKDLDGTVINKPGVVIPGNDGVVKALKGSCEPKIDNMFICETLKYGLLKLDNEDDDALLRRISPGYISNSETGFNNTLNSFMDHSYNEFSIKSMRRGRFVSLVEMDKEYNITFLARLPYKFKINLQGAAETDFVIINLQYDKASPVMIKVLVGENLVPPLTKKGKDIPELKSCGQNVFDQTNMRIRILVNGNSDCVVKLQASSSLLFSIKLKGSYSTFQASDLENLRSQLCLKLAFPDPNKILIAGVREGSVIADLIIKGNEESQIEKNANETRTANQIIVDELANYNNKILEVLKSNSLKVSTYTVEDYNYTIALVKSTQNSSASGFNDLDASLESRSGLFQLTNPTNTSQNNSNAGSSSSNNSQSGTNSPANNPSGTNSSGQSSNSSSPSGSNSTTNVDNSANKNSTSNPNSPSGSNSSSTSPSGGGSTSPSSGGNTSPSPGGNANDSSIQNKTNEPNSSEAQGTNTTIEKNVSSRAQEDSEGALGTGAMVGIVIGGIGGLIILIALGVCLFKRYGSEGSEKDKLNSVEISYWNNSRGRV